MLSRVFEVFAAGWNRSQSQETRSWQARQAMAKTRTSVTTSYTE